MRELIAFTEYLKTFGGWAVAALFIVFLIREQRRNEALQRKCDAIWQRYETHLQRVPSEVRNLVTTQASLLNQLAAQVSRLVDGRDDI